MEIKRDGTLIVTEALQEDNSKDIFKDGTTKFNDYSEVGITDGLLAYLPLDGSAREVSDKSSTVVAHNMTYTSESAVFNGTSSWMEVTHSDFSSLNNLSLSVMFKWNGGGGGTDGRKFIFETAPTYTTDLYITAGGNTLQAYYLSNTSQTTIASTPSSTYLNTWRHAVVTIKDKNSVNIYVDGIKVATADATTFNSPALITSFNIGTYRAPNNRWFSGEMKQLKIFNRALTDDEIKTEYNTMFNNEVQIRRSGDMLTTNLEENTKEIQIMAGLYYNAENGLWTFKKDELTPAHNPDIPLYLMIETRGRNGFTVSRDNNGGGIGGYEMFMPIDDVLNGTEESLDVTAMVHRQIERKTFKPGSFKEGNRLGVRYNVNAEGEVSNTPYSEFILADREFRDMYPGTEKSKKTYYTKMRFIIGYFEDNNPYNGRHKKYQWGKKGKDGPDVGCVLQLFYTVDSATPDTIHIDNLNKRININL